MNIARRLTLLALLIITATPVAAQEYYYNNGAFVGLGVQGSIENRERRIHYGFADFCGPTPFCVPTRTGFKGTDLDDATVSPVMTFGYKFTDDDIFTVKGDYAHYSANGNFNAPSSTGFITVAVDGANGTFVPPILVPFDTNINTSWDSDAMNASLEYQRRVLPQPWGGLFALLGLKMRYESQSFTAKAKNKDPTLAAGVDSVHESLQEFLYGPYAGLKLAFKPAKDSKWNFGFRGDVGWYFKNANFDAKDRFPFNGNHFKTSDDSTSGTLFAGGGVNVVYAINRNWFVEAFYEFNWIQAVSNIWNTRKTPSDVLHALPSRIADATMTTHTPGLKVIYKFD
jgi:hypothetical protein